MRVFKQLQTEAGRRGEGVHDDREHARDVGICLRDGGIRFQPGEAFVAEISEGCLAALKLKGGDHGGILPIEKMKRSRQDTHDDAAVSVYQQRAADDGRIAAKLTRPIAIGENHGLGIIRQVIFAREQSADNGLHPQERKRPIRDA